MNLFKKRRFSTSLLAAAGSILLSSVVISSSAHAGLGDVGIAGMLAEQKSLSKTDAVGYPLWAHKPTDPRLATYKDKSIIGLEAQVGLLGGGAMGIRGTEVVFEIGTPNSAASEDYLPLNKTGGTGIMDITSANEVIIKSGGVASADGPVIIFTDTAASTATGPIVVIVSIPTGTVIHVDAFAISAGTYLVGHELSGTPKYWDVLMV